MPGDIVERYGVVTMFQVTEMPSEYYTSRIIVSFVETGEAFIAGATEEGWCSSLVIGAHSPAGQRHEDFLGHKFMVQSVLCEWRRERITDLQPDAIDYFFWECYAAVPVDAPKYREPMQSPRYRTEMDRRKRVSSNTSRHERRARAEAKIDRFDPLEVYERDEWMCQICGAEVNREVLYPDSWSATLDHIVPLSRGGNHTRENSALAHLYCNLKKSAN
ncbi:HNH endonuclease [Cryobacterium mannosilyticum]|nr:HNH endonuclease [Cryobacterium mannosilyticum]